MIDHQKHINLLEKELISIKLNWDLILQKPAADMLKLGTLYVCKYVGYDNARRNILVKFNNKVCLPPRKNEKLVAFVPSQEKQNFKNWGGLTYEKLYLEGRYLSFETSSRFYDYAEEYTTVGLSGISEEDVDKLKKDVLIYLGPPDEPIEYIANLLNHLKSTKQAENPILNISITQPNWNPNSLVVDSEVVSKIQLDLIENDAVIIQGPPGTGKTYLMALLCAQLLKQNNRILVTTLTNRALIELAEKEHLQEALGEKQVYKASLTADESKNVKIKGIQAFKNLAEQKPPLLLATYYVMSQIASKAMADTHFDYIIIEEASQALLSTIAIAKKLGEKCIIIGDINQLEPIFHKDYAQEDTNNYHWMINGLKTISYYLPNTKQYILTDSYRLTQNSVDATNVFYNGFLKSKSSLTLPLDFTNYPLLSATLNKNGGTSLKTFSLSDDKKPSNECTTYISNLVNEIQGYDSKAEIAILAFNRESVRHLQSTIFTKNTVKLLIETIDRVQGLTVDFCIVFIPLGAMVQSLQSNRFNVATSRAKTATLIIADNSIHSFINHKPIIKIYFNNIPH